MESVARQAVLVMSEEDMDDSYVEWISVLDMRGPGVPLLMLRDHLQSAPEPVREHQDYAYYLGYHDGRLWFEGDGRESLDARVRSGFEPLVPMGVTALLERHIATIDPEQWQLIAYLQGVLDGCILHLELGGAGAW